MKGRLLMAGAVVCLGLWGCSRSGEFVEDPRFLQKISGTSITQFFAGHYPCDQDQPAACQRLKVWLVFYTDDKTGEPTSYQFGYMQVGEGNKRNIWEGKWSMEKDDPERVVYSLDEQAPVLFRRHWLVDDRLLLTLDEQGKVRPGDRDEAYVLAKTDSGFKNLAGKGP